MRFLVFDTETTGLPKTKIISPSTLNQWPHIVQFSYILYDSSSNDIIETKDNIVKLPENILIPEETTKFHGITNEISTKSGKPLDELLREFFLCLRSADKLIGHFIEFDINMVKIELLRMIHDNSLTENQAKVFKNELHFLHNFSNISCTLKDSIKFCNIQTIDKNGKPYLKYPKLNELHEKLFEVSAVNLHNSFNDILVTLRCFMKLKYDVDLMKQCEPFQKYSYLYIL
jgi:DNA polymerase III epsilon subunit-like protein